MVQRKGKTFVALDWNYVNIQPFGSILMACLTTDAENLFTPPGRTGKMYDLTTQYYVSVRHSLPKELWDQ